MHEGDCRTLLGLDFGSKRIGVAVGQTVTGTANPLQTIAVRHGRPDWEALGALIALWAPEALVVGMPVNMDGSKHSLAGRVERFCRQLAGRYRLPVFQVDERLTSEEAASRGARAEVDAVAAQVILESWLSDRAQRACGAPG